MPSAARVAVLFGAVGLLLLAGAGPGARAEDEEEALGAEELWALRAVQVAWGDRAPPLTAALAALNASSSPSSSLPSAACVAQVRRVAAAWAADEVWALHMADASVKVPTGVLALHTKHFGNWDECVGAASATGDVRGHMCFVGLGLGVAGAGAEVTADAPRAVALEGAVNARGDGGGVGLSLTLQLAQCVPSACREADVQKLFSALLGAAAGGAVSVRVKDGACSGADDRPALDAADWTAVGVLSVLGALVVCSTAFDAWAPDAAPRRALLAAFSVLTNGRKLLAPPRAGADASLACLHGVRVLSMCWVVLGHRYMTSAMLPSVNPMFALKFFKEWYRIGLSNATLSVDTFFVLSGLLVGYLFFKQEPSKRRLNIPLYYLHRYIRLTPALAFMVLLGSSLLFHMGWGPTWMATMEEPRAQCQKSWWNTLLYVSNYVDPDTQCVGQSWYLMVDMQLHWLSPLLLLPLARWPRVGVVLMAALSAGGVVVAFVLSYRNSYPANLLLFRDAEMSARYFNHFYTPAYTRFVPYVLGVWTGWALAARRGRALRGEAGALALAWMGVAALLLVPLVAGFDFLRSQPAPGEWTALYNALHRPTWAAGVAGLVYLCAGGRGGPVNALLSWSGFQVLGRFSYSMFLVHMAVQSVQSGALKTSVHIDDGAILAAFAGDLASSLVLGGVLTLLCESPFIVLEKELLGAPRRAPAPSPAPVPDSVPDSVPDPAPSSAPVPDV